MAKRLAFAATLLLGTLGAAAAFSAPPVPVLWTAGGLDAGNGGVGQAARMAVDADGNVAIVSGPAAGRLLAVTSYTPDGVRRWERTVAPSSGTFVGDWVAAAPGGDFVAVGRNVSSSGLPIAMTLVRYATDGTLLWRVDIARTRPSVARLLVDAEGDAYLAFNSLGDGHDIELHKYDATGTLLWAQGLATTPLSNDIATSLALGPGGKDVVLTGDVTGGALWITAAYDTDTGARRWLVTAAEGLAARDVAVSERRVYVTGMGNVGIDGFLTVIAYDRSTGARIWRRDLKPADATGAAGLRIALAPDGSVVVAGQAARGFLDWYTVAMETDGTLRWEAVRDGGLNTDEVPRGVLALADGTTVVTGPGGPQLPGGFIRGVTAGYGPDGTLLWEGFSAQATVWPAALPNGQDVCATGGYDALITCWRPGANQPPTARIEVAPASGPVPLTVILDGATSSDPDGTVTSWAWRFGDGTIGTGQVVRHKYRVAGVYRASLTVTDDEGATAMATVRVTAQRP